MAEPVSVESYKKFLKSFMGTPMRQPTKIVPLAEGEEGYGQYKLVDDKGEIHGYCGEQTLRALGDRKSVLPDNWPK